MRPGRNLGKPLRAQRLGDLAGKTPIFARVTCISAWAISRRKRTTMPRDRKAPSLIARGVSVIW